MKWIDNLGKTRTPPRTGWGSLFLAKLQAYQVELLILVGFLSLLALINAGLPAARVGDGSDYYAMLLSWCTNLKPFMTPESWQAYQALQQSGEVADLMEMSDLWYINLPLRLGQTTDFTHFWFYSFLAFLVGLPFQVVGLSLSVHTCFLLLHALLLSSTWIIAYRCYAWKGLVAITILTGLSPIIWFFDKAHTELFTFCLTTSAIILFLRKRYLLSAFCLSLAATQNISFAAISGLALVMGLYEHRSRQYSLGELALFSLSVAMTVISPLYAYFRFGVLSPQQLFGYIQFYSNLPYAYIWFFDPDIGLFPHWPFGLILLSSFPFIVRPYLRHRKQLFPIMLFVGMYLAISLIAQSSTVNLNAGGNPGVSRYALWYLALFFPLILLWVKKPIAMLWVKGVLLVVILISAWYNLSHYHPGIDHFNYVRPSAFSFWVQKNLPGIYNPPVEIFSERFGNRGENLLNRGYLAVMGPDCRKLLLIDSDGEIVLGSEFCNFDRGRLSSVVQRKAQDYSENSLPVYSSLSKAEFESSRNVAQLDTWYPVTHASQAAQWLLSGWSYPESWGTWMVEEKAVMRILCPPTPEPSDAKLIIQLELVSLVSQNHPATHVTILVDKDHSWAGTVELLKQVNLPYTPSTCQKDGFFDLFFEVDELASPLQLGLAADQRTLGIGLPRFRFLVSQENEP